MARTWSSRRGARRCEGRARKGRFRVILVSELARSDGEREAGDISGLPQACPRAWRPRGRRRKQGAAEGRKSGSRSFHRWSSS